MARRVPQTKFEQSFQKKYKVFWDLVISWSREVISSKRVRPAEYPRIKTEYEAFKSTIEPLIVAYDRGDISDEALAILADAIEYARRRGWAPLKRAVNVKHLVGPGSPDEDAINPSRIGD
jgi:hypothetical protein